MIPEHSTRNPVDPFEHTDSSVKCRIKKKKSQLVARGWEFPWSTPRRRRTVVEPRSAIYTCHLLHARAAVNAKDNLHGNDKKQLTDEYWQRLAVPCVGLSLRRAKRRCRANDSQMKPSKNNQQRNQANCL